MILYDISMVELNSLLNLIFCLLLSVNKTTLVSGFINICLISRTKGEKCSKIRYRSGLPIKRFRKVFRILIKAKYACYKEIFHEIISSFAEQAVKPI